jgi:hypothetical protein
VKIPLLYRKIHGGYYIMRKLSKFLAIGAILALGLTACGSSQKADTTSAAG